MATSGDAIKAAILARLENTGCDFNPGGEHCWLQCLIDAIANGVYDELQNLDDATDTGHQ